ncbi:M14 family metallopeptidase [Longirhabdus pacifica]|uniref:M14 family metallopeptidase n=1 Tax=Longirhabdus pacifica TaxID=2305227 RepID=UPI001008948B|nr:M14 family metallopeptidase [Longirhabdus pacifica]
MTSTYIVQRGDTLYRIAKRYGIHLQALIAANPQLTNTQYVVPGQIIYIPIPNYPLYVIQSGDTLYTIAKQFNVSLPALVAANMLPNPNNLQVGQTIIIPTQNPSSIVDTSADYGYVEMMNDLQQLKSKYPFIDMTTIGKSVMQKDIPMVQIGNGTRNIHFNGSFHANEWITTLLLMKFIEDYAQAYQSKSKLYGYDVEKLFEDTMLFIVPMVNPDGVELVQEGVTPQHPYYDQLLEWNDGSLDFSQWKANIRGVDLNDQYPANWEEEKERRGTLGPGPRDYPGTAPLTEPEAIIIARLTENSNFQLIVALHTQGEEIYWNYRDLEPPISEEIAQKLSDVSGYKAVKLTGSDAGYKDWFIQQYRRPGFTVEAGLGRNPLPIEDFSLIYKDVAPLMLEALKVVSY